MTQCYSCGIVLNDDEPMCLNEGDPVCQSCKTMLGEYELEESEDKS